MSYFPTGRQLQGLGDDPCSGPNPSMLCTASIATTESGSTSSSSVSASDFDSTKYPGICKPRNLPAMAAVTNLQKQLNRVAAAKAFSPIGIDGAIGPATLALFTKVQAISGGSVMGDASACINIAADSDVIGDMVKALADGLNAPSVAPAGQPQTNRTIVTKVGNEQAPPAGGDLVMAWSRLGTIAQLGTLAALGGAGWYLISGRKKRRK